VGQTPLAPTCLLKQGLENTATIVDSGYSHLGWSDGMLSGEKAPTVRTIKMRRALKGASSAHYTFDAGGGALSFIQAVGTTPDFSYHGPARGSSTLFLIPVDAPSCVCRGARTGGSINGIVWSDNCSPDSSITADNNPSCSIEGYSGGMTCCHHGTFLLDSNQTVPPETFTFQMRMRFYYEDPTPVSGTVAGPGAAYQNAFFMFQQTEAWHGEYDVMQCPKGTPPDKCVYQIQAKFQLKNIVKNCQNRADVWCAPTTTGKFPQSEYVKLVHVSPHCHGPACLSMQLINLDTNETLCYTEPHYGRSDAVADEVGYSVGIPPCIWGTAAEGLAEAPLVHLNANLTVIERSNSTYKHLGGMGHWQMRGIWGP